MTLEDEVRAVLAERYADLVDRAAAAGDAAGLLRAGDKLTELLDTLPVRAESSGGGAAGDGGGARASIHALYSDPPTVGDAKDS